MIVVNQLGVTGQFGDVLVELGPLAPEAAMTLFRNVAGAAVTACHPDTGRRLVDQCEGIPLLICGAAGWLWRRANGRTWRDTGPWLADPGLLAGLWWRGHTIEDSVRARLDRLPEKPANALRLLCRSDPTAGASAVADHLGCDLGAAEAALQQLLDAHLLDEAGDATGNPAGRARHGVPREFRVRPFVRLAVLGT